MDVYPRLAAPRTHRGAILTEPDQTARIFQRALEVAPELRVAFLDKVCAGDAERRGEVESLLRHHEPGTIAGMLLAGRPVERSRSRWTASITVAATVASKLFQGQRRQAMAWIVAALCLGGIGYWTRDRVQQSLRSQIREQLRVVLSADVSALETWIDTRTGEAGFWAGNAAVRDLAERLVHMAAEDPAKAAKIKDSPLQREFDEMFRPFLAEVAAPLDATVVLVDRTGLRVAATHPHEFVAGRQSNQRSAAALATVFQGHIKFFPPSRVDSWAPNAGPNARVATQAIAPLRDASGQIFALLALVKLVDSGYSRIFTAARMGDTGETYAISPEGFMLSPSRFDSTLKKIHLLPDQPTASSMLTVQARDPGGDLTRGYQPALEPEARPLTAIARVALASRGKTAEQQTGVILEPYRDYRGVEVVGAWRWLPEHDFAVVTEVDADEAFVVLGYVGRAFEVLFALLCVFVALTLVASVALARMRLGSYTLLHLIGEGGMGKVYMARHALLRRPTAVKVLTASDGPSHELVRRFEREVQAVSRLTHPNTIQIYDFGRTPEGTFYYAMEYLPGVTLAELVSLEGPVAPGRVVHILNQLCGSLGEAHQQGLVHRDIKPLNIMLCERGGQCDFVKVLDFGLVKQLDGSATIEISAPDRVIGTPLYMAPERFRDPAASDPRSDIYSVGAVAFFLLTGRPMFQALTNMDLQNQVLYVEPERPSLRVPHPIPSGLERLVLQCVSKDPADRPASTTALLELLETLPDVPAWTQQQAQDWWARHLPGRQTPAPLQN